MALSLVFFFISITSIFLREVFQNSNKLEFSSILVLLTPFFLFLLAKIEKKKIFIPLKETIVYLIFIAFSIISTAFAVDIELAIRSLLIYISGYFFFIFSFNYSQNLSKYFKWFLILISASSCLIFFFKDAFHFNLMQPGGMSLFYNYGHYQIGNLLTLGSLTIFPNPLSLLFLVFIVASYSRTALISLIIVIIIKSLKDKLNKNVILIGGLIIIIGLVFVIFKTHFQYLTQNKQLTSSRDTYFSYAINSIKEFPSFGIGPGNFVYAVFKRQVNNREFTDSAENMFLEILSENGILAGAFFMIFVTLIFLSRKKNVYYYLFLSLTLMFMTDFSYHFNLFLITWFVLGGLALEPKKKIEVDIITPITIIFIIVQVILFSQILLANGLWMQSLILNPFQKNAYRKAIYENIKHKNKQKANYYLQKYDQIFGNSLAIFEELNYHQALGEKEKSEPLYEKTLLFRSFINVFSLKKTWFFYIDLYGNTKGNQKMADILKKIKKSYSEKDKTSDIYTQINNFCLKTDIGC